MSFNKLLMYSSNVFKLNSCLNRSIIRNISISNEMRDIFKIQDENDYKHKVLNNNQNVVIVDFYASWCGPCKQLLPRLETIIGSKVGKVDLAKVDVDENETIASQYQVSSVPTVIAFKNGKIIDRFIGLKDEDQLRAFVGKALNE